MQNCIQSALDYGLSESATIYYDAGELLSELRDIFQQIRQREAAAAMHQQNEEAHADARRRSFSMDQSLLSAAWTRIYDWRKQDWFYFNTYVRACSDRAPRVRIAMHNNNVHSAM